MRTMADKRDGGWVLNGAKNFIRHVISGETCVLFAITDRDLRPRGISAFVVERGTNWLPRRPEREQARRAGFGDHLDAL